MKKNTRKKLLSVIFAEAKKRGIDPGFIRDEVAPSICGARLSQAQPGQLMRLIEHLTGSKRSFPPSRNGLLQELETIAKNRWGYDFTPSLNAFVNSHRKAPTHYRFLSIADLKAIKERLKELNA